MPSTTRSGNPRKRAAAQEEKKEYGKKVWGAAAAQDELIELEVPSGEICRIIRPGVQGLIQAGVLHDLDSLSALVDQKHLKRVKGKQEVDVQSLLKDQKNLENLFHVVDRVVSYVVREPEVVMAPNDPTNRKEGVIYTDYIELEDKMYILNFVVGGTRDIEQFRRESRVAMGNVADGEGVQANAG